MNCEDIKVNSNYILLNSSLMQNSKTLLVLLSLCGVCCPLLGITCDNCRLLQWVVKAPHGMR